MTRANAKPHPAPSYMRQAGPITGYAIGEPYAWRIRIDVNGQPYPAGNYPLYSRFVAAKGACRRAMGWVATQLADDQPPDQ